jgi:hypothetical protein
MIWTPSGKEWSLLQLFLTPEMTFRAFSPYPMMTNPAHHFHFAVEFRYASTKVSAEVHSCDILDGNRCSILDLEDNVLDVRRTFNITVPSNEIFCGRNL